MAAMSMRSCEASPKSNGAMGMRLPPEGDCATTDGGMNPLFDHTRQEAASIRVESAKARAICKSCPVLAECRDWAARFTDWSNVTLAAWTATGVPKGPPWAPQPWLVSRNKVY